jgi:hypothetical protein
LQDGGPAQYANIVTEFPDETFPRCWIERGGLKQWPPRSPDLTPLDFYFGGGGVCEANRLHVYSVRIHNIQHLKQRIGEAAASVTPHVLGRVWQEMEYRLDLCRATNEAPIELR